MTAALRACSSSPRADPLLPVGERENEVQPGRNFAELGSLPVRQAGVHGRRVRPEEVAAVARH